MTNDFLESLVEVINSIPNLPMTARCDYLTASENLAVYSLPGGQVVEGYMDGKRLIALNFEIAIKSTDQQVCNSVLWQIDSVLNSLDVKVPSLNGSYEFDALSVQKPFLNDRNEQGYYIYLYDVTANIII